MSRISTASAPIPSVATAGWPPCRSPTPKPFGQDHEPVGTGLDELADTRGAATGTQRTGGAIALLVVFSLLHDGSSSGIPSFATVSAASLNSSYKADLHQKMRKKSV